jgi:hypothetical protein
MSNLFSKVALSLITEITCLNKHAFEMSIDAWEPRRSCLNSRGRSRRNPLKLRFHKTVMCAGRDDAERDKLNTDGIEGKAKQSISVTAIQRGGKDPNRAMVFQ